MRLIKMDCDNCGAQLEIDLDHIQLFCPYCGQKLLMDGSNLSKIITEKEKTKRTITQEEHHTRRTQMAYDHEDRVLEKTLKAKSLESNLPTLIIGVVILVLFIIIAIPILSSSKNHKEKIAYLQRLEIEIEEAIQSEDFDTALFKANKLYCDDDYSSRERKTWDKKRESYLTLIEEKKKEHELNDPNTIFMPTSSSSLKGKDYSYVYDQLESLGFTNISLQPSTETAGLFQKNGAVEHILIGGKTSFTKKDYFNKEVPIIIYYYSK